MTWRNCSGVVMSARDIIALVVVVTWSGFLCNMAFSFRLAGVVAHWGLVFDRDGSGQAAVFIFGDDIAPLAVRAAAEQQGASGDFRVWRLPIHPIDNATEAQTALGSHAAPSVFTALTCLRLSGPYSAPPLPVCSSTNSPPSRTIAGWPAGNETSCGGTIMLQWNFSGLRVTHF